MLLQVSRVGAAVVVVKAGTFCDCRVSLSTPRAGPVELRGRGGAWLVALGWQHLLEELGLAAPFPFEKETYSGPSH